MKILCLLFFSCLIPFKSDTSYQEVFQDDYKEALEYLELNKKEINQILNTNNVAVKMGISILFPERIRYSILKDFFETKALETFYVQGGSENVDFSIGPFQMKPSFVENLEKHILKNQDLAIKYDHILIKNQDLKTERKKRVQQLKSLNFQLEYLCAFHDIVSLKFDLSNKTQVYKLKFYAAAYNSGFNKTADQIEKNIQLEFFPYGTKYPGKQHAYSAIAYDFYLHQAENYLTN